MSGYSWSENPWVWVLTFERVPLSDAKAKPIIFARESVRAILEGRKTQERRPMKPQPAAGFLARGVVGVVPQWPMQDGVRWFMADGMSELVPCPCGKPGDVLRVKERGNPCRIMLQLTDVRVQRVRDISAEDAAAEGCSDRDGKGPYISGFGGRRIINNYAALWDSINAKRRVRA